MSKIYKFTEDNDWEGEEWSWFVRMSEEEHKELTELIAEMEEWDCGTPYSISSDTYDEETVEQYIETSDSGYLDDYADAGTFNGLVPDSSEFEESDPFHKGQFAENYCN